MTWSSPPRTGTSIPGEHWATGDEGPNFVDTWPVHCAADTPGAEFHENLDIAIDELFLKGRTTASYTGFDGGAAADESVLLGPWLHQRGVTDVDVVGIATDHCVRATALDAKANGFETRVLLEHCAGVAPETTEVGPRGDDRRPASNWCERVAVSRPDPERRPRLETGSPKQLPTLDDPLLSGCEP